LQKGRELVKDVSSGLLSAITKVMRSDENDSGGGAGAAVGGSRLGSTTSGGGNGSDDDFELLSGNGLGRNMSGDVVSLEYDEQSSLEMLGKVTVLRPVIDLEIDQSCECAHCTSKIPIIDPENKTEFARRCEYDGKWYCDVCHINDEAVVPSYILHGPRCWFDGRSVADRGSY
jgi:hypothetical protein